MERRTTRFKTAVTSILIVTSLAGCHAVATTPPWNKTFSVTATPSPAPDSSLFLTQYLFPTSFDPSQRYLFYLHGRIIEDQGIPAFSPEYGEYEYEAILKALEGHGFVVISEQRPRNTDGTVYAEKVVDQINLLLDARVPPDNITVVGASRGAGIATTVSFLLKNEKANFVLLGFCAPDTVEELIQKKESLYGNVLAIHDSVDDLSGSCQDLFAFSEGKGLGRHDEIVLRIGTGHGILYKPLDEWILPTVRWAQSA